MDKELLLVEVEDVLRTAPSSPPFGDIAPEELAWVGRACAVIDKWDHLRSVLARAYCDQLFGASMDSLARHSFSSLLSLLHQARHDLRMETAGPTTVAIPRKSVFEYFDDIRKIIELAKHDLLFVDPYLDAEFVSRYLPHVSAGVSVRLLAREKLAALLSAVGAFARQHGTPIEVRSAPSFHDRYVFVDRAECYQSGASFKDGAKAAPTTLTQITDAFAAVLKTYEDLWSAARVER